MSFVGTYDVKEYRPYKLDGNSAYGFVHLTLKSRPNTNTMIYNVAAIGNSLIPSSLFLAEQYTANTFRRKKSLGQISWAANYPTRENSVITEARSQDFIVTGKSGIYAGVTRVVIDFQPDGTRLVHFDQRPR